MNSAIQTCIVPALPIENAEPLHVILSSTRGGISLADLREHMSVEQKRLAAGEYLYRAGQPFKALYLVHVGTVKTVSAGAERREQVISSGQLLGIESIGASAHIRDALALKPSSVWELPYPAVLAGCAHLPVLEAQLTFQLAAETRNDRTWMPSLEALGAEQRIAALLLLVAARQEALGLGGQRHLVVRMSRADIGNVLELDHDVVTRALTRFSVQGCISAQWREVRILDVQALRENIRRETAH